MGTPNKKIKLTPRCLTGGRPGRACIHEMKKTEWSKNHVYIGRKGQFGTHGNMPDSAWRNPWPVTPTRSREAAIREYENYMEGNDKLKNRLGELTGKTLVCACRRDQQCHADVLIKMHEERRAKPTPTTAPSGTNTPRPLQGGLEDPKKTLERMLPNHDWIMGTKTLPPERIRHRILPREPENYEPPLKDMPENVILHCYAGPEGADTLAAAINQEEPHLTPYVYEIDNKRDKVRHDMLNDHLYYQLALKAAQGQLMANIGGPNCRTWSYLLHIYKPGAPRPKRGRTPDTLWGLPEHELTHEELQQCDDDSLLMLRMITLTWIARAAGETCYLLEHPADPEEKHGQKGYASFWATDQSKEMSRRMDAEKYTFDECTQGGPVPKPTTIQTDLKTLSDMHGQRCRHGAGAHKDYQGRSADLARWPWGMMLRIAKALADRLKDDKRLQPRWGNKPPKMPEPEADDYDGREEDDTDEDDEWEESSNNAKWQATWTSTPTTTTTLPATGVGSRNEWVRQGSKLRPLQDGAGMCSPGRLRPSRRPEPRLEDLGKEIMKDILNTENLLANTMASIMVGDKEEPFDKEKMRRLRNIMAQGVGMTPQQAEEVPEGQPFHLGLMTGLLKSAGDPDWEYPKSLEHGVPLGVNEELPGSPGVWPPARRKEDEPENPKGVDNYDSAQQHEEHLHATYEEEARMGMVEIYDTEQEAADRCNCSKEEMCYGALGAKDEGDKVRTIHDGTVVQVNRWIRMNTPERQLMPTVADGQRAIAILEEDTGERITQLRGDASKAHRRTKVLRKDWKYMAAKIGGKHYINKVGTYGVASAQYYWGRLAAAVMRILYSMYPQVPWLLVFVDDFEFLLYQEGARLMAVTLLATLVALGVPLQWKKTVIGVRNIWLGFVLDTERMTTRLAPTRLRTQLNLLEQMINGETKTEEWIQKAAGFLNWTTTAYPTMAACMQPIYYWLGTARRTKRPTRPPRIVPMIARCMAWIALHGTKEDMTTRRTTTVWGASDAAAGGDKPTCTGGWWTTADDPRKDDVEWFAVQLTEEDHTWAWESGDPQKKIAAVEMYGTLQLTKTITMTGTEARHANVATDNQGNSYSLGKRAAKKMPNALFVLELFTHLAVNSITMDSSHARRNFNTWADQLSNLDFDGFDMKKRRYPPKPGHKEWIILDDLLNLMEPQVPGHCSAAPRADKAGTRVTYGGTEGRPKAGRQVCQPSGPDV